MAVAKKYQITEELLPVMNAPEEFYFRKAEDDLLRAALKRSHKERFW